MRISGGEWSGQILVTPWGAETRPTSDANREALFNILTHSLAHDMQCVLDLFAGTGALSLEAMSRGAARAILYESDAKAQLTIEKNFGKILKPEYNRDWAICKERDFARWPAFLKKLPGASLQIDTIFCDPPYGKGLVSRAFRSLERVPEVFAPTALAVVEVGADETAPALRGWEVLKDRVRGATRIIFYKRLAA